MLGRTTDATYLLPQTVKVQIPRQHGPDVVGEPERVQQRQQRQQTDVHRVREPGLDRDGVVREAAVRARRVVDDEYLGRETKKKWGEIKFKPLAICK